MSNMIARGLALAEDEAVGGELARRLERLVVDEFQDTSPLQLALFTRLHFLAGRSVWVGDPKQCIFEYAGADPLLMDAVAAWVGEAGGSLETLPNNHRSRPELVLAFNRVFVPAFARFGTPPASVEVSAARAPVPEQSELPPLGIFWLETKKAAEDASAIAGGVVRLLAGAATTPVVDRQSQTVRPLAPGDIAILAATNAEAEAVAVALEERGIGAALARPGLMRSPEGTLAKAALGWLLDPADALAGAVLDALTGWGGRDPDDYLAARIAAVAAAGGERVPEWESDWTGALARVRTALDHLSPSETLERALFALDAPTLCARWPEPEQRGGNLDALIALAAAYEERCQRQREAATLAGLLRYMDEAATPILTRDEERASDEQHVRGGEGAVTVTTYHRAKGLEWPVVILASLDRAERRSPFDVTPESDSTGFDPSDPLAGRWIRYWPWPFGQQQKAPLALAADASPEGWRVRGRESRERVRLLYVGFTRARDHLILAMRRAKGKAQAQWLGELAGEGGQRLVGLPVAAADGAVDSVVIGPAQPEGEAPHEVPARVWVLPPATPGRAAAAPLPRRFARPSDLAGRPARPGYWIAPSSAADEWPELAAAGAARIGQIIPLGGRVDLRRAGAIDWAEAGRALHAFFAADSRGTVDRAACRARQANPGWCGSRWSSPRRVAPRRVRRLAGLHRISLARRPHRPRDSIDRLPTRPRGPPPHRGNHRSPGRHRRRPRRHRPQVLPRLVRPCLPQEGRRPRPPAPRLPPRTRPPRPPGRLPLVPLPPRRRHGRGGEGGTLLVIGSKMAVSGYDRLPDGIGLQGSARPDRRPSRWLHRHESRPSGARDGRRHR